jgi:hypothetical protein
MRARRASYGSIKRAAVLGALGGDADLHRATAKKLEQWGK